MATGDQSGFEQLLQTFLSTDNDIRTQAENAYQQIELPQRLSFLLNSMMNAGQEQQVRVMAAVLVRRLFTQSFDDLWQKLNPEAQASLKTNMVLALQQEPDKMLKKKVCEATAELAKHQIDKEGRQTWPEILKSLFEMASSSDPLLRMTGLQLFSSFPTIFGIEQHQHLDIIKQMLHSCLVDQSAHEVRFESMKAALYFLEANTEDTLNSMFTKKFQDLLPGIMQTLAESIQKQDDDSGLKCMIDLVETSPKFIRPQIVNLIELCLKSVADTELENNWRQLALEVIVSLSESAPQMLRKHSKFLDVLVPQLLGMMVELDDEDDWSVKDEVDNEDTDSNTIAGESGLDRLCCGLGGKVMLPHIMSNIPPMLQHADWKYRHAGLMAVSACGEGCHHQMEPVLEQIIDAVVPFCTDKHPRVRYAACNALGQLSTDFAPVLQRKYHAKVVQSLLTVMDDHDNPRVQAHAGAAFVNFSEECPKNILAPYLGPIIAKLEAVLQKKFQELVERGTKLVLEQVVVTLASVADTAEDQFAEYYDRFMPALKYILKNATQPELRLLRGKTIECISLMGLAVGKERFKADCPEIVELLLKVQMSQGDEMATDDPQMSYMISAWTRICKIMGKEFQQYLPHVMGPLLAAARIKPEVTLLDSEEANGMQEDEDWQVIPMGDSTIGIRTAGLEDKATACQMLVCYARELQEAFVEYTQEVATTMVPHLKFYFNDEVRIAAAEIMPLLLDCAKAKGLQYVSEMWAFICPELIKAFDEEPEAEVQAEMLHSMSDCIQKLGRGSLVGEHCKVLVRSLSSTLQKHMEKQFKRQQKRSDEDYDEDLEESLMNETEEDVWVLSRVSDVVHSMFATHKEDFLPFFEELVPHFTQLLMAERPWQDRQWALCAWDDVVEHTGEKASTYLHLFGPSLIRALADPRAEVRQAGGYGIGVMAMNGSAAFSQTLQESLPPLIAMINEADSRSEDKINPTENAISAVTKLLQHCPGVLNPEEVLPHWLSWLPTWEDKEEAEHIYGYLCTLVEGQHPVVLGPDNANLPRIVQIFSTALQHNAFQATEPIKLRVKAILTHVQSNAPMFEACANTLNDQQKQALSSFLAA